MRGNVDYFTVEETLPYLSRLIYAADTSTVCRACWGLSFIAWDSGISFII